MPRKNGLECLSEIKQNEKLKHLPVVIYSTSVNSNVADVLYNKGAHYYMKKTNITALEKSLQQVFTLMAENSYARPSRERFILDAV
jgi:CheY-like chemotaxis protein